MACTTILVGKKASYDGSTMIARNDDSQSGVFTEKKFTVVLPENQPKVYKSVISGVEIPLKNRPMKYTAMPNALSGEGIWAAAGVNEENISMSATETITSNERVLGADPLVKNGIGEEDIVVLVLPYIHSAREGVLYLGNLLKTYGTYEMNGIAFQDQEEIWWLETIGGHHWMAKRVPDDHYVVMPNQQGIDSFDFEDAYGDKKDHLCSSDLKEFTEKYYLDLSMNNTFNPRLAYGSHSDSDHTYNTPRAWSIEKYLNPSLKQSPLSDTLPWALVPERKITVEDVKYVLSDYYQGTIYDPYSKDLDKKTIFRPIGINRTSFLSLVQIRPYMPKENQVIEWFTFGSNVFNAFVPVYTQISSVPNYVSNTTETVDTHNFYWANRLIGALSDAHYSLCSSHIERYQLSVHSKGHQLIHKYDEMILNQKCTQEEANQFIIDMLEEETNDVLSKVLYEAGMAMKNSFSRSDA